MNGKVGAAFSLQPCASPRTPAYLYKGASIRLRTTTLIKSMKLVGSIGDCFYCKPEVLPVKVIIQKIETKSDWQLFFAVNENLDS